MKLFVSLGVLVCAVSLVQAYPSRTGDSLDRKKEELLTLEQELKGMLEEAETDVKGINSYETKGVEGVKGETGYGYGYSAVKGMTKADVKAVTKAEFKGMTKADVKGVAKAEFKGMTKAEVKGVTKAEVKGEVKGQSLNDPDTTAFDPVREPPNVLFNRHYVAFQSVADSAYRLECERSSCSYFDCGGYLFSYPEWRECYNAVFKVYRRDGEGVLRVGDYIGFIQFSTNQWIQCPHDSCLLGDCPGVPNDYDGFEDALKWCECDDYVFRLAAYNKTVGQPLYPNDVVMIYQPKTRTYIDITGDKTTCPGTVFPPALEAYEECIQGSYFLNY